KRYLGREDWYRSRAFMVNLSRSRRLNLKSARQRLKQEGKVEKSGAVIAGLTFHFWVALHESKYRDTLWTPMLRHIWPKGENLRRVHRDLFLVRDLLLRCSRSVLTNWHRKKRFGLTSWLAQASSVSCGPSGLF
ncbi:MAG: hypothetical protein ACPG4M_06675, partial [Alphaproteobacteria bacterium]